MVVAVAVAAAVAVGVAVGGGDRGASTSQKVISPAPPTVAARSTHGCSLLHLRLQAQVGEPCDDEEALQRAGCDGPRHHRCAPPHAQRPTTHSGARHTSGAPSHTPRLTTQAPTRRPHTQRPTQRAAHSGVCGRVRAVWLQHAATPLQHPRDTPATPLQHSCGRRRPRRSGAGCEGCEGGQGARPPNPNT